MDQKNICQASLIFFLLHPKIALSNKLSSTVINKLKNFFFSSFLTEKKIEKSRMSPRGKDFLANVD
jgi:hypothetical protein